MKRIIFLEGVDSSGKTTIANKLQQTLIEKFGIEALVVNMHSPAYYASLVEVGKKNGFVCSLLSKLSYRVARMNLVLGKEIKAGNKVLIFDRGLVNVMVDSLQDGLEVEYLTPFVQDILSEYHKAGILLILLKPDINVVYQRLSERATLTEKEKDRRYIHSYYKLSFAMFEQLIPTQNKVLIDTGDLTVQQSVEVILSRITY